MSAQAIDWPGLERVVETFLARHFGGTPGQMFVKPWGWTRQVQRYAKKGQGTQFGTELRVPMQLDMAAAFCTTSYVDEILKIHRGPAYDARHPFIVVAQHLHNEYNTPLRHELARWWGLSSDFNALQSVFKAQRCGDMCAVTFFSPFTRTRRLPSPTTIQQDFRLSRRQAIETRKLIEQADANAGHPPTMNDAFRRIAQLWDTRATFSIEGIRSSIGRETLAWWVEAPPDGPSLIYDISQDKWLVTSIGYWEDREERKGVTFPQDWLRRLPA